MVTIFIKALIVVGSLFVGACSVYLLKMKPDNIVEQISEEIIKDQTGLTIDLSPETGEADLESLDNKTPAGNDKPAGVATDEEKTQ